MLAADASTLPVLLAALFGAGGITGAIAVIGDRRRDKSKAKVEDQANAVAGFVSLVQQLQEAHDRCLDENEALRGRVETLEQRDRQRESRQQDRDRRLEMIERDLGPPRGRRPLPPPR